MAIMDNILPTLEKLEKYLNHVIGLLAVEISFFLTFILSDSTFEKLIKEPRERWSIYLLLLIAVFFVWLLLRIHLPRAKKKSGIMLAITTENDLQKTRIRDDFVSRLNNQIMNGNMSKNVEVLLLTDFKAKKMCELLNDYSKETVLIREANNNDPQKKYSSKITKRMERFRNITKCSLYIWGSIKERLHEGKSVYDFSVDCLICHDPISPENADQLIKDIVSAFPKELISNKESELEFFKFSADSVYFAAKYFLGISAFISGSLDFAIENLSELLIEIKKAPMRQETAHMLTQIPKWISDAYALRGRFLDEKNEFEKAIQDIEKAIKFRPDNYLAWLLLARSKFNINDLDGSFEAINKGKLLPEADYSCLYSIAFLTLYEGKNFEKALKRYQKAIRATPVNTERSNAIVESVLKHISKIILERPTVIQLHFAIGYIKYMAQGNMPDALSHYEKFIEISQGKTEYDILRKRAMNDLAQIKGKIGFK